MAVGRDPSVRPAHRELWWRAKRCQDQQVPPVWTVNQVSQVYPDPRENVELLVSVDSGVNLACLVREDP